MDKRIGWAATTASISAGILLAIYEVMERKMPVLVANILIAIASLAGFIAVIVLCHAIWIWSRPTRKRYALRSPVYRRDKPNPLQWLIDISEKQKLNPITHLVVTDCIWLNFNRDSKRPYLRLQIYYKNLGVHELVVDNPEGYASYRSEKLPERIEAEDGCRNVPADGVGSFNLDVYIPDEFLQDICAEIDSATGEVRNLGLQDLSPKVYVKGDDTHIGRWNLGQGRLQGMLIFRPSR